MPKTTNSLQNKKELESYKQLIETVAKVEFKRLSASHLIEIQELTNIGTMTVHLLLKKHKSADLNKSYITTAIKWAIRNELRRRYKWYASKSKQPDLTDADKLVLREAVYETILSIDNVGEEDNTPLQVKDDKTSPDESVEINELNLAIRNAIKKLPQRERLIIENRFFNNMKLREMSDDINVSASRTSRIIQSALNKIKEELQRQGLV